MNSFAIDGRFADDKKFAVARQIKVGLQKGGWEQDQSHPDVVICVGGDGSLLKSLNTRDYEGRYLLVNGGTLGFMGDYRINEAAKMVYDLLHSQPVLEEHAPLIVENSAGQKYYAANDISLVAPVRAVNFDLFVDDERLSAVQGSGIIVASAMGSTAFQLSLGGPILLTGDDCYAVSLVAPLKNKVAYTYFEHLVLTKESRIKIRLEQNSKLYRLATDGIEIRNVEGHEFTFYPATDKKFSILRYRHRSQIKRVAQAFGKL